MRLTISSLAAVLGSLLVACAGTAPDAASSEGAATASSTVKLQSGHFDEVDLVVANGTVSGAYFSSVGDPAHGGATCSFTFTGTVSTVNNVEHATISALDGWDTTTGSLDATMTNGKPGFVIKTADTLNACMRSSPMLTDPAGVPEDLTKAMESGVTGYATVGAAKASFYSQAGGNPRVAYVVQGDTIVETGAAVNGFMPAKYVGDSATTTGFLRVQDLMIPAAPPPAAASPLVGKFELKNGAGIEGGFEITAATDSQISFNITAVTTSPGHNIGDIESATAPLANGVATYSEDDASCTLAFTFDPTGASADVTQTGQCGDFGMGVDVSGHYAKQ